MTKILAYPEWLGRAALFIVYFWFGLIKIFGVSAVNPLVKNLLVATLPFIPFEIFIVILGGAEMIIGFLWLWPKMTKTAGTLLSLHIFITFVPLILLPAATWQYFLVPTLEGQFIIKNILIVAVAFFLINARTNYESKR